MLSVQNKGSALAFLFVLLVMCVGVWAAFSVLTGGTGSRVVAVESVTPAEALGTVTVTATLEATSTPAETPLPGGGLSTPVVPSPTPVSPMTPTPVSTPTSTPAPAPSPSETGTEPGPPSGTHQYGIQRNERDCSTGGVIGGWVYDAGGSGLAWARISLYNDYGWSASKQSEGPPQAGKYEFTMGSDAGLFHLLVVDEGGQPLSPVVDIDYQPNCSYHVDWQRVG
jgi:hypothetical protein